MIVLSSPPTNVAIRSFWQAGCGLLGIAAGLTALAAGSPAAVLPAAGAFVAIYLAGIRHEALPRRLYGPAYRLSKGTAALLSGAVLRVLHAWVLPSVSGAIPAPRFERAHPGSPSSLWRPAPGAGDPAAIVTIDPPALRRGRPELRRFLGSWVRRPGHRWMTAVYPYLRLLDACRADEGTEAGEVPTNTYTLY